MSGRKRQPKPDRDPVSNFYGDQFTPEELALVAAFVSDPTLDDELWLQRVLNHRLFQYLGEVEPDVEMELTTLVKVATALATGTGRVGRLLRDRRALSGEAADGLTTALANALDELATELGVQL